MVNNAKNPATNNNAIMPMSRGMALIKPKTEMPAQIVIAWARVIESSEFVYLKI